VAGKISGISMLRDLIPWESFRPLLEELTEGCTPPENRRKKKGETLNQTLPL